eukprot:g2607.t1
MSKNRRKRASNKEKLDPLTRSRFERLKKHKWILAFGDSLTAGFRDAFKRHTPYAKNLQSTLRAEATSYMNSERHETKQQRKASMQWKGCRVVVEAVCGESTQEMLPRLELSLQEAAKNGIRYDTIVILAGTNDLISLREVDDIALSMREMIAAVADAGISSCVVCTVPEMAVELKTSTWKQRRDALNSAIWKIDGITIHGSNPGDVEATTVSICDLEPVLPAHKPFASDPDEIWSDDGIHLKEKGYDVLGAGIGRFLVESSALQRHATASLEKLERDLARQQRLQNRQDRKDSILEAERMKEAERLQKENEERSKMKSKAWKAGAPARAAKAARIAEEEARARYKEDLLRVLGELLGDIFSGAWDMAEERRLKREADARAEKKARREKRQLERIDKVIVNVMSKRLVMSHRQLMAALFGKVASNPDRGLLEARIVLAVAGGLMEKQEKNGEGAKVVAIVSAQRVQRFDVQESGSGYVTEPRIVLGTETLRDGGTPAAARATIEDGKCVQVKLRTGDRAKGSGYVLAPTVTVETDVPVYRWVPTEKQADMMIQNQVRDVLERLVKEVVRKAEVEQSMQSMQNKASAGVSKFSVSNSMLSTLQVSQ